MAVSFIISRNFAAVKLFLAVLALLFLCNAASAQVAAVQDSSDVETLDGKVVREVTISSRKSGRVKTGGLGNTEFKQKNAIISADNPWSPDFDATMIYGPVHGAVFYIGARINWNKI